MHKCSHCGGALEFHMWGEPACIMCGREKEHIQKGPYRCKDCRGSGGKERRQDKRV